MPFHALCRSKNESRPSENLATEQPWISPTQISRSLWKRVCFLLLVREAWAEPGWYPGAVWAPHRLRRRRRAVPILWGVLWRGPTCRFHPQQTHGSAARNGEPCLKYCHFYIHKERKHSGFHSRFPDNLKILPHLIWLTEFPIAGKWCLLGHTIDAVLLIGCLCRLTALDIIDQLLHPL